MNKKLLLVFILAAFILAACAPDPEKQARADAITRASIQAAADAEAQRQQDLLEWEAQRQQDLLEREAQRQATTERENQVTSVLPVVILAGALGGLVIVATLAAVIILTVRAKNQPATPVQVVRYPVFFQPLGGAKYLITDTTTGQNRIVDMRHAGKNELFAPVLTEKESTHASN